MSTDVCMFDAEQLCTIRDTSCLLANSHLCPKASDELANPAHNDQKASPGLPLDTLGLILPQLDVHFQFRLLEAIFLLSKS